MRGDERQPPRDLSQAAETALNPGITWFGWAASTALQIFMVFALGMTMPGIAIWEFNAGSRKPSGGSDTTEAVAEQFHAEQQ